VNPRVIVSKSDKLAQRMFEDRMLVVTAEDSMLHRLNDVGTFIWGLLDSPRTVDDICRAVAAEFDGVDAVAVEKDVVRFVDELRGKGLVEVNAGPQTGRTD
jgi:hypothetical protein